MSPGSTVESSVTDCSSLVPKRFNLIRELDAVMPGHPEGHQRIEQPAEHRRPLADVGRQGDTAGVAETRYDKYLRLMLLRVRSLPVCRDQRLEQILVIAGDTARSAITIADQSNDADGHGQRVVVVIDRQCTEFEGTPVALRRAKRHRLKPAPAREREHVACSPARKARPNQHARHAMPRHGRRRTA
jgi:hypothetical protein